MSLPVLALFLTSFAPGLAGAPASGFAPGTPSHVVGQAVQVQPDVKNGDVVSAERQFTVVVLTDDVVTKVEFYVGSELQGSESSSPYKFTLDTLGQSDGPLDLKWIAYTDQGRKGSITVHVKVDNELALGAPAHVTKGQQALQDGKFDDAIAQGRIALKIDKKSDEARFLLAGAYLQKGVYDRAQKYVQDVLSDEPKNLRALNLATSISLNQAFATIGKNETASSATNDRIETLKVIGGAFKTAIDDRRKAVDIQLDAIAPSAATALDYAAAADRALRFSDAINVLKPIFDKATTHADVADMLAYSQTRAGRSTDALETIATMERDGNTGDAYAHALKALLLDQGGDSAGADHAMDDAILDDLTNLGVRTAQATLAMRRLRLPVLSQLVNGLVKDEGQMPEVNYLLSGAAYLNGEFEKSRSAFLSTVLAEPLFFDAYILEAGHDVGYALTSKTLTKEDVDFDYADAEMMYENALEAKQDSYQALVGLSLVAQLRGRLDDGIKYAEAAVAAQPSSAAAQYALASAADVAARAVRPATLPTDDSERKAYDAAIKRADALNAESVAALNKAGQLDPAGAGGRPVPSPQTAATYFLSANGASLVIASPLAH